MSLPGWLGQGGHQGYPGDRGPCHHAQPQGLRIKTGQRKTTFKKCSKSVKNLPFLEPQAAPPPAHHQRGLGGRRALHVPAQHGPNEEPGTCRERHV